MEKDLEYRIEQFMRFPEELSRKEYAEIEKLIENNQEARQIAEWLGAFYADYDLLDKPRIISLTSQKYDPKISGPMVLAAMSPDQNATGLLTKATFASEEYKTLLRILEYQNKKEYQFHVISKYVGSEDRVLIEIESVGLELVTEKGGILKKVQNKELSDVNWEESLALVRVPLGTCEYKPNSRSLSVCDLCTISVEKDKCSIHVIDSSISRVLVDKNNQTELHYLDSDFLELDIDSLTSFKVHLYS